jgi:bifunctional non-homologous end joining protein LigD
LTFVAFDVLAYDDGPVIDEPYVRRHALLDGLALNGPAWCTTPQLHANRVDSTYRPGERSSDWIKLKTPEWKSLHAPRRHEH